MSLPSAPPPPALSEPPLWAPYYGASLSTAFGRFWKKYATFSGRASRSEFWWWELIYFIFIVVFEIIFISVGAATSVSSSGSVSFSAAYIVLTAILWVISLGTLIPNLALIWRRLHDTNRSGGFYFLGLIPFIGGIILLVFLAGAPNPLGARFDQPRW